MKILEHLPEDHPSGADMRTVELTLFELEVAYRKNRKLHRLDGPARIRYRPDGSIHYRSWWINGDCVAYTISRRYG